MVLPASHRVPRAPRYLGYRFKSRSFHLHGYHILWPGFPTRSASLLIGNFTHAVLQPHSRLLLNGLGFFHFARRYSGNHCCFLFLQVLRWFTSLGSLVPAYGFSGPYAGFTSVGFPIRTSPVNNACLRLAGAFRSLPRLSSPASAKASTMRP